MPLEPGAESNPANERCLLHHCLWAKFAFAAARCSRFKKPNVGRISRASPSFLCLMAVGESVPEERKTSGVFDHWFVEHEVVGPRARHGRCTVRRSPTVLIPCSVELGGDQSESSVSARWKRSCSSLSRASSTIRVDASNHRSSRYHLRFISTCIQGMGRIPWRRVM